MILSQDSRRILLTSCLENDLPWEEYNQEPFDNDMKVYIISSFIKKGLDWS
jgi:hypothetical protein